jgi:hypothetical protein
VKTTSSESIVKWAAHLKRPFFAWMIFIAACQPTPESKEDVKDIEPKKKTTPKVEVVEEKEKVDTDTNSAPGNQWTNIYARDIELYFMADTNWSEVSLSQQEQLYTMLEMSVDQLNQELELAIRHRANEGFLLLFSLGDDYSISEFELNELISSQSELYTNLRNVNVNGLSYFIFDVTNEKVYWQKAMAVTMQGRPFSVDYIVRNKNRGGAVLLEEVLVNLK